MTWQTDICGKSKPGVWQDGYLQPCFEDVIVFGLLFLYIIVFGSYRIYQLSKVPKSLEGRMRFWAHSTKIVCHSIVAFVPWLALILRFFSEYSADTYQLFYYFGLSVTFCFSLVITEIEFSRRTLHNWVLMSWWTLSFICSAIKLQTMVAQLHVDESMYFELPLFVVGFIAILILACFGLFYNHIPGVEEDSYRKLSEDEQERLNSTISINSYESNAISRHNLDRMSRSEVLEYHERNRPDSLEESANIFSKLLFSWLSPILATGFERVLEDSDLPKLIRVDTAVVNGALFRHEWQKELELRPDNPSIAKVLGRSYLPQFISSGVLKLFQDILQFVGPVCLNLIVAFISNPLAHPAEGYTLVIALVLCSIIQTVSAQTYFNIVYRISIQIRGALVTAIYRKGFKLSADSRQKSTVGEFVNNMSIDTQRICDLIPYIHLVWSAPLQVIVCLGMLFFLLGWSVISGITLMIVMIPINGIIMRKLTALQKLIMKSKDERVRSMNELLQGIRLIKFFAWERSFEDKITGIRDAELKNLKTAAYYRAIITFFWMSTPLFVSIVTFTTFALAGNLLTPEIAFTSLALFNILRFPLNMLPTVISSLVEAKVSSKRLHTLFLSSEMDPNIVAHYEPSTHAPSVLIRNGTFSWGFDETLQDINLSVQPGELMAIIGSVGSGKSSILSTFLGNMKKLSGDIELRGTVAYVSQEAWIQNATLRENILFGSAFHPERYQRVINCCQLTQDLDMLPAGDLTEIGEKGINLSGGQKQRVAMARAVYQNADIYLLDDPLSAVDAHVGRAIFEECICHVLQGKTRILVTHQLQFLNRVNKIAVLTNGRISEIGTYEQLMEDGDIFSGLIRDHVIEGDGDSKPSASSSSSSSSSSASTEIVDVPEAKPKEKKEAKLISTEEREIGEVRLDVYKLYIFALGGAFIVTSILLMMAFEQAGRVATDWWLSYWSDNNELHSTSFYLSIYTSIGAAAAAITLVRSLTLAMASFNSAKKVHERLLENIMRVPMAFFDTTPVGRILNRFSKDQYTIDDTLPRSMGMFLTTVFASLAIICVIGSVTPFFLTALLPLGYLYRAVQRYYIRSSREMKRLDSVSRSPIYAHFGETLTGVNTIRAFDKTGDFVNQNEKILDANQRAFFINNASNRWLGVRLEFVGTIVVTLSALFAVMERDNLDPGAAGLSLTYALQTTSLLNWLVRMYTDTESQMVSVERMEEYSTIEREAPPIIPSRRPPPGWPETGSITFENYKLRYRPGLDLVLKDISVKIQGGQKIGIVGRTGAGKSSLMLALFRLVEPAGGKILIDEVDISTMGLEDLRTKISIIPQDPTLFTGSVRSNLDPFSQYEDPQIWKTLEAVHLKDAVMVLPEKLESAVAEFGGNFSVGQRQLMCLGRALLKSSRIIVMDEATASVDYQTDALIQQTMREEFRNCTVLTIAHRIKTILDYDKVLVLDQGYVAEYDSPEVLRRDPRTAFYSMVNKSGTAHVDE